MTEWVGTTSDTANAGHTDVDIVVLTHIPYMSGYHKFKLDVLKVCLESIRRHTRTDYRLLVFDNGSSPVVQDYLNREFADGRLHSLIRSERNIGKIGAFQMIFRALQGTYAAYFDDDVYAYPGWLEAHLEILNTYPQVGMVSGSAIRERFSHAIESNLCFAEQHAEVELLRGRFLPETTEREFVESTGRWWPHYYEATAAIQDIQLTYRGVSAYAAANHFQFVAPVAVMREALPVEWSGRLMGQMRELDERIDDLGYLRLSTMERCTRHMGNQLSPEYQPLLEELGVSCVRRSRSALVIFLRRVLVKLPGLKRLNAWLNKQLYGALERKAAYGNLALNNRGDGA